MAEEGTTDLRLASISKHELVAALLVEQPRLKVVVPLELAPARRLVILSIRTDVVELAVQRHDKGVPLVELEVVGLAHRDCRLLIRLVLDKRGPDANIMSGGLTAWSCAFVYPRVVCVSSSNGM